MGNKTDQGVDLSLRQFIKSLGGIAGGGSFIIFCTVAYVMYA